MSYARSNKIGKWLAVNKREEFLKNEVDRLENELLNSKKNEIRF